MANNNELFVTKKEFYSTITGVFFFIMCSLITTNSNRQHNLLAFLAIGLGMYYTFKYVTATKPKDASAPAAEERKETSK